MKIAMEDIQYHLIAWDSHKTLSYGECLVALMQLGMSKEEAENQMQEWRKLR